MYVKFRMFLAIVVIFSIFLQSLAETTNATVGQEVPQSPVNPSNPCDLTPDQLAKSYNNNSLDLSQFNFDLNQLVYELKTVSSIPKDSWYDYIVVGAGTAGSVVANRLSEDPSVRILLLEAGGKEDWFNNLLRSYDYLSKTWRDFAYYSVPQKECCRQLVNSQIPLERGKLIGGCTAINGIGYQRGAPEDFDRWSRVHGAEGWSFPDVFPYFIKSENIFPDPRLDPGYHGTQGPLPIKLKVPNLLEQSLLDGIAELGYSIGDFNGRDPIRANMVSNGRANGLRYSMGRAFLAPVSGRPNLDILIFARADRILFDNGSKKAIGVEYTANSVKNRVFARREIIISAGVIDTPKLLLLSGIGPADDLKSLGIPVLIDSPGVGKNLHDQPFMNLPFATSPGTSSFNLLQAIEDFVTRREGPLTIGGSTVWAFFRTKYAEDSRPDLEFITFLGLYGGLIPFDQSGWQNNWKPEIKRSYYQPYEDKDGFQIQPVTTHPRSRGWVKLASKDPDKAPLFNYNMLSDDYDVDVLVEGCKLVQRVTSTRPMKALNTRFLGVVEECKDLPLFSDEFCRCMVPIVTSGNIHPVGSAKMGSKTDKFAVVDPQLRVNGVEGLRIADASVIPEIISGHPMAAVIMIGERCADFIKGRSLRPTLPPIKDERKVLSYD